MSHNTQNDAGFKLVKLTYQDLYTLSHSEVARVPSDMSDNEIRKLMEIRNEYLPESAFSNPQYYDVDEMIVEALNDPAAIATVHVRVDDAGYPSLEPLASTQEGMNAADAVLTSYPQRLVDFIEQCQPHIKGLQTLLNTLVPQKDNASSGCMHLTIKNALMALEQAIDSLSVEDMQPDPDWIQTNLTSGYLPLS